MNLLHSDTIKERYKLLKESFIRNRKLGFRDISRFTLSGEVEREKSPFLLILYSTKFLTQITFIGYLLISQIE